MVSDFRKEVGGPNAQHGVCAVFANRARRAAGRTATRNMPGKITSQEDICLEIWSGGLRVQFELGASNDSLWRKCSGSDENIPKFNAIVCIDIQDLNGGEPTFRLTGKNWSHPAEMTIPLLAARME